MQLASQNKLAAGQPSVGNTTASRFEFTGFSGPGLSEGGYDMEALGRDPPAPNRKGAERVERPPRSSGPVQILSGMEKQSAGMMPTHPSEPNKQRQAFTEDQLP